MNVDSCQQSYLNVEKLKRSFEFTKFQFLSQETPAQRLAYPRNLTIYRSGIIPPPWDYLPFKKLGLSETRSIGAVQCSTCKVEYPWKRTNTNRLFAVYFFFLLDVDMCKIAHCTFTVCASVRLEVRSSLQKVQCLLILQGYYHRIKRI